MPTDPAPQSDRERVRDGLVCALIAYVAWGFLPIYFKVVDAVPAGEVLVHRILWAVPFGLPIVLARRQWPEVAAATAVAGYIAHPASVVEG